MKRRISEAGGTPVTSLQFNVTTVIALCAAIGTGVWTAHTLLEGVQSQIAESENRINESIDDRLVPVITEINAHAIDIGIIRDRLGIRGSAAQPSHATMPASGIR